MKTKIEADFGGNFFNAWLGQTLLRSMRSMLIVISLLVLQSMSAATWIVDSQAPRPADFRGLQRAIDSERVIDGDVLLVRGNPRSYGAIEVIKRLKIIGQGYLHEDNMTDLNGLLGPSMSVRLGGVNITEKVGVENNQISSGAGSVLAGLHIARGERPGDVLIGVPNVTFERCFIQRSLRSRGEPFQSNGLVLINCVVGASVETDIYAPSFRMVGSILHDRLKSAGGLIQNCTFSHANGGTIIEGGGFYENCIFSASRGEIEILGISEIAGIRTDSEIFPSFRGCVFASKIRNISNPIVSRIVDQESNTFISDSEEKALFKSDDRLERGRQLAEDSPAQGKGLDGLDPGAFGGPRPYVLSGLPRIPRITELRVPSVISLGAGLPVRVKAESTK